MSDLNKNQKEVDVFLIGAGIMSTTLGVYLKELNPNLKIEIQGFLSISFLESYFSIFQFFNFSIFNFEN